MKGIGGSGRGEREGWESIGCGVFGTRRLIEGEDEMAVVGN